VAFNPWANASGGVYASPSLSKYSGQVVNHPTVFAFASGAGLMGEAGPEAILPLKRGTDGKLGVASAGGGVTLNQTINVDSSGSITHQTSTGTTAAAAKAFADNMKAVARKAIMDEQRPGGSLWRMAHP
jgi:phage-related minor tail protein